MTGSPTKAERRRDTRQLVRRGLLSAVFAFTGIFVSAPLSPASASTSDCAGSSDALTALGLSVTASTTAEGTPYDFWSGKVASWDGLPLAVDLTVPAGAGCNLPLISLNHGMGDDRTGFEAKSALGVSTRPWTYHWNNAWFAEQGMATLNFTARGLRDSCGRTDSSDGTAAGLPSACTENGRHYWFQFADMRYDSRDLQWLLGRLVDAGIADPSRLAVSGGSLGGGLSWSTAILNDRIACGGAGWDVGSNGADPCADADSATVPWTSPNGTSLHIAAAVPEFSWASLSETLLPNGRRSDGTPGSPTAGPAQSPIGVPLENWISQLRNVASNNGFTEPPGRVEDASAWGRWFSELQQQVNSQTAAPSMELGADLAQATDQWDSYKSPLSAAVPVDGDVPIMQVAGLDDSIMSPVQAQELSTKVRAFDPRYPVSTLYGDLGHAPAANASDVVQPVIDRLNGFLDYELRGVGPAPDFSTKSYLMRCVDPSQRAASVTAPQLSGLEIASTLLTSNKTGTTRNSGGGKESTGSLASGARCAHMASQTDAGVAAWTWRIASSQVVVGAPTLTVRLRDTAPDAELDARLWDISSGSQYLMTRSTYRLALPAGSTDASVTLQLPMTSWTLPGGDTVKLELTGYDAPTFQADSIANVTTIDSVSLSLPSTDLAAAGTAASLSAKVGKSTTAQVARFSGPSGPATSYSSVIDWGDGATSAGVVTSDGKGHFTVTGTHTWASRGTYTSRVSVTTPTSVVAALDGVATVS